MPFVNLLVFGGQAAPHNRRILHVERQIGSDTSAVVKSVKILNIQLAVLKSQVKFRVFNRGSLIGQIIYVKFSSQVKGLVKSIVDFRLIQKRLGDKFLVFGHAAAAEDNLIILFRIIKETVKFKFIDFQISHDPRPFACIVIGKSPADIV